jgi:metal-responsive CopG/Arc/MetJ family transcriptional regulator
MENTKRITISLTNEVFEAIDDERGKLSMSTFINNTFFEKLKEKYNLKEGKRMKGETK